jgi:hypothetical protein
VRIRETMPFWLRGFGQMGSLLRSGFDAATNQLPPLGVAQDGHVLRLVGTKAKSRLQLADPLIGLGMSALIMRITWQSWRTARDGHAHSY